MFYNTFKELFEGINIDSMKEVLLKVSMYNSIITKFIDEINSKYGMALTFTTLEPFEVGHWAETFHVASDSSKAPESPRPLQAWEEPHRSGGPQQTVTEWPHQQTSTTIAYKWQVNTRCHHRLRYSRRKLTGWPMWQHYGQLVTSKG